MSTKYSYYPFKVQCNKILIEQSKGVISKQTLRRYKLQNKTNNSIAELYHRHNEWSSCIENKLIKCFLSSLNNGIASVHLKIVTI